MPDMKFSGTTVKATCSSEADLRQVRSAVFLLADALDAYLAAGSTNSKEAGMAMMLIATVHQAAITGESENVDWVGKTTV